VDQGSDRHGNLPSLGPGPLPAATRPNALQEGAAKPPAASSRKVSRSTRTDASTPTSRSACPASLIVVRPEIRPVIDGTFAYVVGRLRSSFGDGFFLQSSLPLYWPPSGQTWRFLLGRGCWRPLWLSCYSAARVLEWHLARHHGYGPGRGLVSLTRRRIRCRMQDRAKRRAGVVLLASSWQRRIMMTRSARVQNPRFLRFSGRTLLTLHCCG
jgi:hypothetical protein